MSDSRDVSVLRLSLAGGLILAVLYTVAPLTVWVAAASVVVFSVGLRNVPSGERRVLATLLTAAVVLRLLVIAVTFFKNLPYHQDQWLGEIGGDGAYGMSRALRARDVLLGVPTTKYDGFVVNDMYGANLYVTILTVLQVLFGPAPYGVRLMNGLLYLAAALVMFHFARAAYGRLPALAALAVVLFLPSFFAWSISLLKEPLYFVWTAIFLVGAAGSLRSGTVLRRFVFGAIAVAALVVMEGVRHKTLGIGLLGWAIAVGLIVIFRRPRRYVPVAAACGVALALIAWPRVGQPILHGLEESAKIHMGHVFTVGHRYKLLDEGFYYRVQAASGSTITLTFDQAARYVLRAAAAFVVTPLPWQMISLRELVYVPEQIFWYVLVALLPVGVVAGWRRDAAATAVLIGYLIPTSVVLALTNGNVGTLVRLRGTVMIILVWLSSVGFCAALEYALARPARAAVPWRAMRPETMS